MEHPGPEQLEQRAGGLEPFGFDDLGDVGQARSFGCVGDLNARGDGVRSSEGVGDGARPEHGGAGDDRDRRHDRASKIVCSDANVISAAERNNAVLPKQRTAVTIRYYYRYVR